MELIKKEKDLTGSLEYYKDYIYSLVKFHILSDWTPVGGMEESIEIIKDHIGPYFE